MMDERILGFTERMIRLGYDLVDEHPLVTELRLLVPKDLKVEPTVGKYRKAGDGLVPRLEQLHVRYKYDEDNYKGQLEVAFRNLLTAAIKKRCIRFYELELPSGFALAHNVGPVRIAMVDVEDYCAVRLDVLMELKDEQEEDRQACEG